MERRRSLEEGKLSRRSVEEGKVFEFRAARRKFLEKASKRILIGRLVLGLGD